MRRNTASPLTASAVAAASVTVGVGLATAVSLLHIDALPQLLLLAVVLSAGYGGVYSGILATALAGLAWGLVVPLTETDLTFRWAEVALFCSVGTASTLIISRLQAKALDDAFGNEQVAADAHAQRGELMALVSHELRNPINAMTAALALLRMPGGAGTAERAHAVLERQTAYLARLAEDLVSAVGIERGRMTLERTDVSLLDVVHHAVEVAYASVTQRQQILAVEAPTDAIVTNGDPVRLQQVVQNLLLNASKYTPTGGRITLRMTCEEGLATIAVHDTGMGLAAEQRASIFNAYVRATREGQGLGLGLYIARHLAERHGGTLVAESEGPGQGSTFTLRLPADVALSPGCGATEVQPLAI